MQESANPISTFLIDEATYQDLVKRANLADVTMEQIKLLRDEITGLKTQINEHEMRLNWQGNKIRELEYGKELQPAQQDRAEILRALLAANGGKMFAKDARNKMHLGKATFSVLLAGMKDEIDKKPSHLNRSKLIISLR